MVAKGFFCCRSGVYQRPSKVVQIRSPVSHALSTAVFPQVLKQINYSQYVSNSLFLCNFAIEKY